jgi:hypothetical protein
MKFFKIKIKHTMKKRIIQGMLVACMLLIGFLGMAQTSGNPVGKWDYSIPDAPAEYATGKAEFKMQDGKLMLVMILNGQASPAYEAVKKDNGYVCKMENEYFTVTLTLNPDGANLKGIVNSDQWDVPITMTPEKK